MSRKDYVRIAQALRDARPLDPPTDDYKYGYLRAWNVTVESIAYELAQDNPRFDPVRFRKACGYGDR